MMGQLVYVTILTGLVIFMSLALASSIIRGCKDAVSLLTLVRGIVCVALGSVVIPALPSYHGLPNWFEVVFGLIFGAMVYSGLKILELLGGGRAIFIYLMVYPIHALIAVFWNNLSIKVGAVYTLIAIVILLVIWIYSDRKRMKAMSVALVWALIYWSLSEFVSGALLGNLLSAVIDGKLGLAAALTVVSRLTLVGGVGAIIIGAYRSVAAFKRLDYDQKRTLYLFMFTEALYEVLFFFTLYLVILNKDTKDPARSAYFYAAFAFFIWFVLKKKDPTRLAVNDLQMYAIPAMLILMEVLKYFLRS